MRWIAFARPALVFAAALAPLASTVAQKGPIDPMPQPSVTLPPDVAQLAGRTLDEMRGAPAEILRTFGLATAAEARAAHLGTPLRESLVPLSALRAYDRSQPAAAIVTGGPSFLFPVVSGDAIRSSIRISGLPGTAPKVEAIGGSEIFSRLNGQAALAARLRSAPGASLPSIRIPALGLYFLCRGDGDALEIAPLFAASAYGLEAGVYAPAREVFARLVPFARKLAPGAMGS